ncbi:hypothetical protein ILUMI_08544 [Ignelater luminosus]|uniref:EF-hand domain-containing protein n=1 Tax=Ignelater luminosus TaxID=2038154 RepID=A0A8K0D5Y0_IGNLU|nr:hypothetical protein ILUMI_08544 [Ignelater luminosus]
MFIDDFISPSRGYLIYLAWPLPMCSVDCPWVYVGDGQCDSACYNSNCQMDGGDCSSTNKIRNSWEENFASLINSKEINSRDDNLFNTDYQTVSSQQNKISYDVKQINLINTTHVRRINYLNHWRQRNYSRLITYNTPKRLNNSKIALAVESTSASIKKMLHLNNTRNITKMIQQHNSNVMLHNKLNRRKRYRRRNTNSPLGLNNSAYNTRIQTNAASIDAYGASLQHTNRVYNLRYGFKSRYVPAHSPIMIEKGIMEDLQTVFKKEFKKTSMNKVRSEDDMQFAFSYYYYLINERINMSVAEIFDRFDTDNSG